MEPQIAPQKLLTGPLIGHLELVKSSFTFIKRHWKPLFSVILMPVFLAYIGQAIFLSRVIPLQILAILLAIASGILSVAMRSALINTIHAVNVDANTPVDIKAQYKFGFKYFWPMIWVSATLSVTYLGGLILFVIPAIIFAVYTAFSMYSLVLENKRGKDALIDSYTLVKHRWAQVLSRMAVLAVIFIVANLIVTGILSVVDMVFRVGLYSATHLFVAGVLQLVMSLLFTSLTVVYGYKLYESLKMTREIGTAYNTFAKWLKASWIILVVGVVILIVVSAYLATRVDYTYKEQGDFSVLVSEKK